MFAFQAPDSPPRPKFISATDTSVTIGLGLSLNDNGVPINNYELWIDQGNDSTSPFSKVNSFTSFANSYTLTTAVDGLGAPGTIYRIKIRAVNEDGTFSPFSSEMIFALAPLPSPPVSLSKSISQSKKDSIFVYWPKVVGETLPILGYRLYADTGRKDDMRLVFDGVGFPNTSSFEYTSKSNLDLTIDPYLFYKFQVSAVNFNGEGDKSPVELLQTCTTPSLIEPPVITFISTNLVSVLWDKPENDGGCPITSYHLYYNQGSLINVFQEIDSLAVSNQPFLNAHDIDTSTWTAGLRYKLKVGVENHVDLRVSDSVEFLLASVPSKPNPPTRISDGKSLKILMSPPANDGGSQVTSY